jgi:hypothetical protein
MMDDIVGKIIRFKDDYGSILTGKVRKRDNDFLLVQLPGAFRKIKINNVLEVQKWK